MSTLSAKFMAIFRHLRIADYDSQNFGRIVAGIQ
jgi:hypothetical protein